MTDSEQNINYKTQPVAIVFGLAIIGFCLWFCTITVYSVFDGTFGGMGGLLMLTIAPIAMFFAFGMARILTYADNEAEAWAVLACLISTTILYASGMTVSWLEESFFPKEVEYRSLNLGGYKDFLLAIIIFPPAIGIAILLKKFERFGNPSANIPKRRSFVQFVRQNWLKESLVTVSLYLVLTTSSFALLAIDPPPPVSESHLSYDDFNRKNSFPSDGSDFCYTRTGGSYYCDFSISEEAFQRWAKTHMDWETYSIPSDKPVTIYRSSQEESFKVVDGLVARRRLDRHSRVSEQAVFDRSKNRVYYYFLGP